MKGIRTRLFKKHPLGWQYRVHQIGYCHFTYYQFKRDAMIHARVMSKRSGEWVVYRVYRSRKLQKLRTLGGSFTDWPGEDW